MTLSPDTLSAALPPVAEMGNSSDGMVWARLASVADVPDAVRAIRGPLGHRRFVDMTALDRLAREERFELQYLFYDMDHYTWLRLKARADVEAPSITPLVAGANWYEREVFDLFGIRFEGHPELRRIMLPEHWEGNPLRRDHPIGAEPVDFTVTRRVYGTG